MKKQLLAFLLLAPWVACAQPTYPYVIKGKNGHWNAPAKIYLKDNGRLDSATLRNGQFELKGTTKLPFPAELVFERQGKLRDRLFGPGPYFLSPDRTTVMLELGPVVLHRPDSLRQARITGGTLTADYQRLTAIEDRFDCQQKAARLFATPPDLLPEYVRAKTVFVKEHPNSWMSLYTLLQLKCLPRPGMPTWPPCTRRSTPCCGIAVPANCTAIFCKDSTPRAWATKRPRSPSKPRRESLWRWPITAASTCSSISGHHGAAPAARKIPPSARCTAPTAAQTSRFWAYRSTTKKAGPSG